MSDLKTEFLKIDSYEKYDKRRREFRNLDINDTEIREHWSSLFPVLNCRGDENGIITELYSEVSADGKRKWR